MGPTPTSENIGSSTTWMGAGCGRPSSASRRAMRSSVAGCERSTDGLGNAPHRYGKHQILPEAALVALERAQGRGQPGRIAGEAGTLQVRVVLARTRQAELQEAPEGRRRQIQQQDRAPREPRVIAEQQRG